MLLQHAWLAPLIKPETIQEEDEEEAEAAAATNGDLPVAEAATGEDGGFVDREVGEWVINAIDRKKRGVMGTSVKPALHAAPLDAVPSPKEERTIAPVAVDA